MEQQIYDILLEMVENEVNTDFLQLKKLQSFYSVLYNDTSLVCRICIKAKSQYLEFASKNRDLFSNFQISQIKSVPDFIRVHFSSLEDIKNMKESFISIIKSFPMPIAFDVCSRYMQCSDAFQCVDPDPKHALGCSYKRKLEQGIVFFGKNRNID